MPALRRASSWISSAIRRVALRGRPGAPLRLLGHRVLEQQAPPELVVVALVGLDAIAVEGRGLGVAPLLAEAGEHLVAGDGDGLAGELTGGRSLDRPAQPAQVCEQRARARRRGVEADQVDAEGGEALLDPAVVLRLVAALAGERELRVELGRIGHPGRRQVGGLVLVAQRELEQGGHGELLAPGVPAADFSASAARRAALSRASAATNASGERVMPRAPPTDRRAPACSRRSRACARSRPAGRAR